MTEPSKDLVLASNAYSRAALSERQQYIRMLATAGNLLPQHLRGAGNAGDPGKAFLLAETGDMLGIHPMAAVTGVHIIEGKPSISANLMTGLVRKAGHILRVTVTGNVEDETLTAKAQLTRKDDPDFTFEVIWTVADAKRAGLWNNQGNWRKYPRAMMKSRVVSEIVREGASDVLMGGNVYTPEELGATVNEQGEPIEMPQVRDGDVSRETKTRTAAPIVDPAPTQGEDAPEHPAEDAPVDPATGEVSQPGTDVPPTEGEKFDWKAAVEAATNTEEVRDLYRKARAEGALNLEIRRGRQAKRVLGPWLSEIGAAFKEAEEAAAIEADAAEAYEASIAESGPAVLADDNVVDAEIVEEGHDGRD